MFCKSSEILSECQAVGEPSSSFPSVSRIMFNRLKKAIELKVRVVLHENKNCIGGKC